MGLDLNDIMKRMAKESGRDIMARVRRMEEREGEEKDNIRESLRVRFPGKDIPESLVNQCYELKRDAENTKKKEEEKPMKGTCRICDSPLGATVSVHDHSRGFMLCSWCYSNIPGDIVMVASNERNKTVINGQCYRHDTWKTHPKVMERLLLVNPKGLPPLSNEEFTSAYRTFCKYYGEDAVSHYVVSSEHAIPPEVEEALFHSVMRSPHTPLNSIEVVGKRGEGVMWTRGEEPVSSDKESDDVVDVVSDENEEPKYIETHVPVFEDLKGRLFIVPPPPGPEWTKHDTSDWHPPPYLMGWDEFVHETRGCIPISGVILYMGAVEDVSHSSHPKPLIEASEFELEIVHENGLVELQEWVRRGVAEQWKCKYFETWRKEVKAEKPEVVEFYPYRRRSPSLNAVLIPPGHVQGKWESNHPGGPIKREEE